MASSGLSRDQVFEVLKSPRRRYALYYLRREGGSAELSEVTDQVAAWENDTTPSELTSEQRKRVYISLYQTHLPKLDDAGIVEYDSDSGHITLSKRARELDTYLGSVSRRNVPWDHYYLVLSVVSVALVAVVLLDVYPFGALSGLTVAAVVLVVYGLSALAQYLYYRHGVTGEMPPELQQPDTR